MLLTISITLLSNLSETMKYAKECSIITYRALRASLYRDRFLIKTFLLKKILSFFLLQIKNNLGKIRKSKDKSGIKPDTKLRVPWYSLIVQFARKILLSRIQNRICKSIKIELSPAAKTKRFCSTISINLKFPIPSIPI